jgi:hypothetical protein
MRSSNLYRFQLMARTLVRFACCSIERERERRGEREVDYVDLRGREFEGRIENYVSMLDLCDFTLCDNFLELCMN